MSQANGPRAQPAGDRGKPAEPVAQQPSVDEELDEIDAESADSFPASDPPSTSVPTTLGAEQRPGDKAER